ncbi:MAG TPA: ABC transporter ATP-binding protein [Humisphaera sp.]|jgi:lipopolysaccharide transport system ATP-binding protein|nr:ABC transporter ATP-binding protein [Humisphaera sp.]
MSSSDVAIAVRGLSKAYTIRKGANDHNTLAETMLARVRHPFRRPASERFYALNNVSFEIKKGESVGIIGRNGAGKSTLLKVLSRVTEPTAGEADLYGRVGSLLEVGTGFHYELTGRENIFLNGAILGMRRAEIRKRFDAIVDFAGVEKFLDTPVKRYSSGMFVRLAFAVAAYLEPEILIVDEVLAVGDADFQKKCLRKMGEVSRGGRTVLFVSHNIGVIRNVCTRGIVLGRGSVEFDGNALDAAGHYMSTLSAASREPVADRTDRSGRGSIRFTDVEVRGFVGEMSAPLTAGSPAEFVFRLSGWKPGVTIHLIICDGNGQMIAHCTPANTSRDDNIERESADGCEIVWATDELLLTPGSYSANVSLYVESVLEDRIDALVNFDVLPGVVRGRAFSSVSNHGCLALPHRWSVRGLAAESAA